MSTFKQTLRQLLIYKSALIGLIIIIILVGISIYAILAIPYDEATKLWRAGEKYWLESPRNALPSWINIFSSKKMPETIVLDTKKPKPGVSKAIIPVAEKFSNIKVEFSFNYEYDDFPSEINIFFESNHTASVPKLTVYWVKPDGEEIILANLLISKDDRYYISNDEKLARELKNIISKKINKTIDYEAPITLLLFAQEDAGILSPDTVKVMKGNYKLWIDGIIFETNVNLDAKLVVYGKVYGWAGTDHLRRDLGIALLWGAPIALSFGVTASVSIALIQMFIGAVSAWFRGITDNIVQRITEIFMVIPFLPILIMISTFYKFNIWVLLVVVIALTIFGGGVKNYRAMFLQIKEFPYVEASRAYGASNLRIVLYYLIPKVLPTIIPSMVLSVADFVFLEAALAILGLGDPLTPTWGKIIDDAYSNGALYKGLYYWVLEPSVMLAAASLSFAMLGFALDKIFNPKLKEI
ncbi:MAG: ABC transporter permease [Candidatus Bathyarchaeia archaeon]|nr:ABC transporter permease [Candidatus Bathyarchaeota archaeon]